MNPETIFHQALVFASEAHVNHKRRSNNTPYISHLMGVASNVMKYAHYFNQDPYLLGTVAILHDTVEDVGVPISTIRKRFGSVVAENVASLTEDKSLPKEERKEGYIESVAKADVIAQIVSFFDKRDNAEDYAKGWGSFTKNTYEFYIKLSPIYRNIPGMPPELIEELLDTITSILWATEH